MKKWIISITVFVLSIGLTGLLSFYAALMLVGPHTGILPEIFFIPVILLLLILMIFIPVLLFIKTFKRFKSG